MNVIHQHSERVGVVGGGLAGLSAACTLAARGYRVTLFEKNSWLGGKAAVLEEQGFRFDMGPTILTVPRVLRRIFEEAGLKHEDCELIARSFDITDVKLFHYLLEAAEYNPNFKNQMFDQIPQWEKQLSKLPRLRKAWQIACEWEKRRIGVGAIGMSQTSTPLPAQSNTAISSPGSR